MRDETILAESLAGIEEILAGDLERICVEYRALFHRRKARHRRRRRLRDAAPVDPGGGLLSELGGGHAVPR